MYIITYRVGIGRGTEGIYTHIPLELVRERLVGLQRKYIETEFKIRRIRGNELYKHIDLEKINKGVMV